MKTFTRKSEAAEEIHACLQAFQEDGLDSFIEELHRRLLNVKVKFPLLEYSASEIFIQVPEEKHLPICDRIEALKTIGGNVLIGIILQKRIDHHFQESLQKAVDYIAMADDWRVPDIIGERVFGWSLLNDPENTIPRLQKFLKNENQWVVRSVGAGCHYAIKKGLEKEFTKEVFPLLLSLANTKNYQVKRGIGWAAKTTARFHPDIIEKYKPQIDDPDQTGQWFRTKVKTGLKRHQHAKGN